MKRFLLVTIFSVMTPLGASAQNCHDKFVKLMGHSESKFPTKAHIITKQADGSIWKNNFFQMKTGHWMTQMIEPQTMWSLEYNNIMYLSTDQGKNWKKIREVNSEERDAQTAEDQAKNAKTAVDAVCAEEKLNEIMHQTLAADVRIGQNINADYRYKYWVNPADGSVAKAVYESKKDGSTTTQFLEHDPDMKLPKPE